MCEGGGVMCIGCVGRGMRAVWWLLLCVVKSESKVLQCHLQKGKFMTESLLTEDARQA